VRQCASEFDFFISRTGKAPIHRYGFPPQASEAEKACMLSATALGKVMTCGASGVSPRICKDRALSNSIRTVKTFESLVAQFQKRCLAVIIRKLVGRTRIAALHGIGRGPASGLESEPEQGRIKRPPYRGLFARD
jgi:hypothetical protein